MACLSLSRSKMAKILIRNAHLFMARFFFSEALSLKAQNDQ